jgi:hypothetical protein
MLNNVVLTAPGRRVLVKGRTHKELLVVEGGEDDTRIEREVLRTSIVVLDLGTGAIEVIDQAGGVYGANNEDAA